MVVPSLNVTVPPGTPEVEVTLAVKVTFLPQGEGFVDELSAVELAALFTVWVRAAEVLATHGELPA